MEDIILLVEDEDEIRELMALYLRRGGFIVLEADHGEAGLELFHRSCPSLVILDVLMPGLNGWEVAKKIREQSDVPLLFVSCKREPTDIIHGLDIGADGYIIKPFDPDVLVAKVKAHLRRVKPLVKHLVFGPLVLNLEDYDALLDGQSLTLPTKERELLFLLAKHPNRVWSLEELYAKIWGSDSHGDTRTVLVHISNVRKKIELGSARFIHTVRGMGYKFQYVEKSDGV